MGANALGHIGPSVRENNRYLKLTALGRRVRLLYTYYLGEVPGQQARRRMDADRDGVLADAEQARFGDEIARTVASQLDVTVDGRRVEVAFDEVNVGIGTPAVQGGAFSVDLVVWLCLDPAAAAHAIVLYDHWKAPDPGETELRVEESPGVEVTRSTFGADGTVSQLHFQWVEQSDPRPLDAQGLRVELAVDAAAADMSAGACAAAGGGARRASASGFWTTGVVIAGVCVVMAGLALVALRRYRNTNG
jgi:hypothetical protein